MKANEAPEKLYMNWVNYPLEEMQVEYTRTDAFIEKTCEWIKMMWSETDDRFKEDYTGMLIKIYKNYMKGE